MWYVKTCLRYVLVVVLFWIGLFYLQHAFAGDPPYPQSQIIEKVHWDFSTLARAARGSDLFPLTWADDNALYTAWGDGRGFAEIGSRKSLGVSRIHGSAASFGGTDVWSGTGKAHGIISIDNVLYLFVTEQDAWMRGKVGRSLDHGVTWEFTDWIFDEPHGVFAAPGVLQFGKAYRGARDRFVYGYSEIGRGVIQPHVALFRVPKKEVTKRRAYEFFAGMNGTDDPVWTADIEEIRPVFTDPNGVGWGVQVTYSEVLRRYLLTARHDCNGGWGIFDAPEPWGPWTTVAYYDKWIDPECKVFFTFNQKWMSSDGREMWMVFSGKGEYDSFNVIKAIFELKGKAFETEAEKNRPINR